MKRRIFYLARCSDHFRKPISFVIFKPLFIVLVLGTIPGPANDPSHPPEQHTGIAFDSLGCVCADTVASGYQCIALPAFEDNEWIHHNSIEFAAKTKDFAAKFEAASEGFQGR